MIPFLAAAAVMLAAPQPVEKTDLGYLTAGELADRCGASGAPAEISYCFAYIAAVHDAMRAYEVWLGVREFCAPPGISQADLRRNFITYLSAYPSNRSGQAASVIVVSLKDVYPCRLAGEKAPPATREGATPPVKGPPPALPPKATNPTPVPVPPKR